MSEEYLQGQVENLQEQVDELKQLLGFLGAEVEVEGHTWAFRRTPPHHEAVGQRGVVVRSCPQRKDCLVALPNGRRVWVDPFFLSFVEDKK